MAPKRKPRICGGCSTTESATWHRQRGNNKFFCADCQAKKLLQKQNQTASTASRKTENVDDEGVSTAAATILDMSTRSSSDSSPELGGENPEPIRNQQLFNAKLETAAARGDLEEKASIIDPAISAQSIDDQFADAQCIADAVNDQVPMDIQMIENQSVSNRIDNTHIDDQATNNQGIPNRPVDHQLLNQPTDNQANDQAADAQSIDDQQPRSAVPLAPVVELKIDEKVDQSKIDRSSPSSTKQEENVQEFVKKQKSPVSHPRLTRLRSAASRPIRQAALAVASKAPTEKQSHSRSSSAAGSSKSVGGTSISLTGGPSTLVVPRNKGRRHIFKLTKPEKSCSRRATISTHGSMWHKGQLFRQSDVVAVVDESDANIYYALIRGLLRDEYCHQFAALTWLVPTDLAPKDRAFDPVTYMQGPEDETFYRLDSLEFICHLDTDYFKNRGATVVNHPSTNVSESLKPQDQFAGML